MGNAASREKRSIEKEKQLIKKQQQEKLQLLHSQLNSFIEYFTQGDLQSCRHLVDHVLSNNINYTTSFSRSYPCDSYNTNVLMNTSYINIRESYPGDSQWHVTYNLTLRSNNLIQIIYLVYVKCCVVKKIMKNFHMPSLDDLFEFTNYLISKGYDINHQDMLGNNLVHLYAMHKDSSSFAKYVITYDQLQQLNKLKETPYMVAKKFSNNETADAFIRFEQSHNNREKSNPDEYRISSQGEYRISSQGESNDSNDLTCVICLNNLKNTLFGPCLHACSCQECSQKLMVCPICKVSIQSKTKIYI